MSNQDNVVQVPVNTMPFNSAAQVETKPIGTIGNVVPQRSNLVDFEGADLYVEVLNDAKNRFVEMIKSGQLSEQTATRLLADFEYSFFQQLVRVKVNN